MPIGDAYTDIRDPSRAEWLMLAEAVFVPPDRPGVRVPMVRLMCVRSGITRWIARGVFAEYYVQA